MFRLGTVIIGVILTLGLAGCASLPSREKDDLNAVIVVVDLWSKAIVAHDVDALLALYSEDFSDSDGNDKAAFGEFIAGAIDQGMLDNVEIIDDDTVMTIDGNTATYNGIGLSGDMGGISVDLTLTREAEGWAITSMIAG